MSKKIAVLSLFSLIAIGLFFIKNEFKAAPQNSQFIILNWSHNPEKITLENETEFTFYLKDRKNIPMKNAQINIEASMNHAGMLPIYAIATAHPGGIYKTRIKLTMNGDWILFLTIKKSDGEIIKKELFFKTDSK